MDPENDRRIAEHVVRMHRYRNPNEQDGEAMPLKNMAEYLSTEEPTSSSGSQTTEVETIPKSCADRDQNSSSTTRKKALPEVPGTIC